VTNVTIRDFDKPQLCKAELKFSNENMTIMKKNMGLADKVIRILAAIGIGALYFTGQIDGTTSIVLGALAVVFIATSFMSFCPLYLPFGLSTRKEKA